MDGWIDGYWLDRYIDKIHRQMWLVVCSGEQGGGCFKAEEWWDRDTEPLLKGKILREN